MGIFAKGEITVLARRWQGVFRRRRRRSDSRTTHFQGGECGYLRQRRNTPTERCSRADLYQDKHTPRCQNSIFRCFILQKDLKYLLKCDIIIVLHNFIHFLSKWLYVGKNVGFACHIHLDVKIV